MQVSRGPFFPFPWRHRILPLSRRMARKGQFFDGRVPTETIPRIFPACNIQDPPRRWAARSRMTGMEENLEACPFLLPSPSGTIASGSRRGVGTMAGSSGKNGPGTAKPRVSARPSPARFLGHAPAGWPPAGTFRVFRSAAGLSAAAHGQRRGTGVQRQA